MDASRWQQIKAILDAAVEYTAATERAAFLDRACENDTALRSEVASLLAHHTDRLDEFADRLRASGAEIDGRLLGQRLGAYRIVRELGRGGMGVVYLGERADERFEKRVAIKLLKRGTDTDEVLRRFDAERHILARLDHPNVARLLDAGTTDDGLPFLVMEHVEGAPITEFCAARDLPLRARLELTLKICDAVQFAHRNLIVHRDIKPANILVTPEGEPKLLDFGIAKLLAADAGTIEVTAGDQQRFSAAYASPEQIRGDAITTASDVYALGALLYELLAGGPPHQFSSARPSATELLRVVAEQEAPRVSVNATSSETRRQLRGDLDNILLTALAKEPDRRYSGVAALADDIRRYLDGRPVRARPATFGYRASKFVRRNKVAVAATALVCLGASIAATAYVAQARREAAYFRDLRKLANLFIFKYHDGITALPGSTELRKELVKDALDYLNNLASERINDPELLRELGTAYKRIADVQGGILTNEATGITVSAANLGDTAGALDNYRKALEVRRRVAALRPGDRRVQYELAESHANMGEISLTLGKAAEGAGYLRDGVRIFEALREKDGSDKAVLTALQTSFNALGIVLAADLGDTAAGLEAMRRSIGIGESLLAAEPENTARLLALAPTYGDTGRMLFNDGRTAEARDYYRKALAIGQSLLERKPGDPLLRREVAVQHRNVGAPLLENGESAEALEHFREAIEIFEQLMQDDPNDARVRRSAAYGYRDLAEALAANGDSAGAERNFAIAAEIFDSLAAKDASNMIVVGQQALTNLKISRFAADVGDLPRALTSAQRALQHSDALVASNPRDVAALRSSAESHAQLGDCKARAAQQPTLAADERRQLWETARASFAKARTIWSELERIAKLSGRDQRRVAQLGDEIARCDIALQQHSAG